MSGPVVAALPMWSACGRFIPTAVYDPDNPWAVRLEFADDGRGEPVTWLISRDLLHDGMCRPVGNDRVRVCPAGPEVVITLFGCEPGGSRYVSADFAVQLVALNAFLCRTFAAVPRGAEQVNWDAIIDRCRQETS